MTDNKQLQQLDQEREQLEARIQDKRAALEIAIADRAALVQKSLDQGGDLALEFARHDAAVGLIQAEIAMLTRRRVEAIREYYALMVRNARAALDERRRVNRELVNELEAMRVQQRRANNGGLAMTRDERIEFEAQLAALDRRVQFSAADLRRAQMDVERAEIQAEKQAGALSLAS